MSSNAQRFARLVLKGFEGAGLVTDREVGEAGGPSTTTLTLLRKVADGKGEMPQPRNDTLRKIERAAHWMPGSARELWLNGTAPKSSTAGARMAEILGATPTTEHPKVRQVPRPSAPQSFEGWVESLADRILELEERLDVLEHQLSAAPDTSGLAIAADEHGDWAGEQESQDEP